MRYVEAVWGQRQGEGSGTLAPLEHLVDLVLAVIDRHAVLDDPGVAVAVGHKERVGVLRHGHGGRFAVVSVVATGDKLNEWDDYFTFIVQPTACLKIKMSERQTKAGNLEVF